MMNINKNLINTLLSIIEQKLGWGASEEWLQRDFEKLIDKIYEQTKVAISLSTIKRIWKGEYKNLPNVGTLNALAQFSGFNDWQNFKATCFQDSHKEIPLKENGRRTKVRWKLTLPVVLLLSLIFLSHTFLRREAEKNIYNSDDFELSLKPVTNKTPNTVYFKYKIPSYVTDTVFLQQSWDIYKRAVMNKDDSIISSIYYYPGYYKTKMVVGDSVMHEIPLQIFSDGWQSLISYELIGRSTPIYINKEYSNNGERYHVSLENLRKFNVDFSQEEYWTNYFNSKDFQDINCSDFSFEATVKNPLDEGGLTCQDIKFYFVFEDHFGVVPLCEAGCASNLWMNFCGIYKDGKTSDLSAFGINLDDWNTIKCTVKDKEVSVFINNTKIYSFNFFVDAGNLKYIDVCFKGSGFMKNPQLYDSLGNLVNLE